MNSKRNISVESKLTLDSIRRIVRALRVSSRVSERDLGLSTAQLFVLQKLSLKAGISVNELAARTLTHQSSVSVVVGKLVRQDLAIRKKSKSDARKVDISLTAKGAALLKRAPEPVQERLVSSIEALPIKTRQTLANALVTVVRSAGISEGRAPLFFEDQES